MSNRIGRLELLFWFVASILGAGILLSIVASLTNTAIEVGRTQHPWSQALCLIVAAVATLKALGAGSTILAGQAGRSSSCSFHWWTS
jgi:phosphotransferase system  glucose/maltose/N-acetylglucosamine-specific IIC component